jgi:hypothetical protein
LKEGKKEHGDVDSCNGLCLVSHDFGERRFAQRLEAKLEDDYLCWYDVPIGEKSRHPDFVVFHPSRGLLVLEVKDWNLDTIRQIDKQDVLLMTNRGLVADTNPLVQARQYMFHVTDLLQRDPQLVWPTGSLKGKVFFPYGHGVVLTNISRAAFEKGTLERYCRLTWSSARMRCSSVDPEAFQKRLWEMFPIKFTHKLSLPQIDRVRWHLFPEIRMPEQRSLLRMPLREPRTSPTSCASWTCNRSNWHVALVTGIA